MDFLNEYECIIDFTLKSDTVMTLTSALTSSKNRFPSRTVISSFLEFTSSASYIDIDIRSKRAPNVNKEKTLKVNKFDMLFLSLSSPLAVKPFLNRDLSSLSSSIN